MVMPWEQAQSIIEQLEASNQKLEASNQKLEASNQKLAKMVELLTPEKLITPKWPAEEPYSSLKYRLDEARTEEEVIYEGDTITAAVSTGGTLAGVTIKFESKKHGAVPCSAFNPISYPGGFTKFYLTHTAQEGKTLYLFIGRAAGASTVPEVEAKVVYAAISGQPVLTSGQVAHISGQAVTAIMSGAGVLISGQAVTAIMSGAGVLISGQAVTAIMSGAGVLISGQGVGIIAPTLIKTGFFRGITDSSGGVVLHSGATKSVIVKSMTQSGYIMVGSASNRPFYSSLASGGGVGLILEKGDATALDVDNFNKVYIVAQVDGDIITYVGVN